MIRPSPTFKPYLLDAVDRGEKLQTRRFGSHGLALVNINPGIWSISMIEGSVWTLTAARARAPMHLTCPYGRAGDVWYVREQIDRDGSVARYRRGGQQVLTDGVAPLAWRWKVRHLQGMYMPLAAARSFLEVVSVRLQRVQQITEADAAEEGVAAYAQHLADEEAGSERAAARRAAALRVARVRGLNAGIGEDSRAWFSVLWDELHRQSDRGWFHNPYVFAITFRRCAPPTAST